MGKEKKGRRGGKGKEPQRLGRRVNKGVSHHKFFQDIILNGTRKLLGLDSLETKKKKKKKKKKSE